MEHYNDCKMINPCDIEILGSTTRGEKQLLTLEALFQKDISPSINTKEEYKSRTLTIKF